MKETRNKLNKDSNNAATDALPVWRRTRRVSVVAGLGVYRSPSLHFTERIYTCVG